jgi:uncharacterized repeat protein (TIGR03803 family)
MHHARLRRVLARGFGVFAATLATVMFAAGARSAAAAPIEQVLYAFCAQYGCADGEGPNAGLVLDEAGNLYGTASVAGGRHDNPGYGAVFELMPTPSGRWTYAGLRYFCQQNCVSGANPAAGLIMDQAGNLYGTTFYGGANNRGVVFEFTPSSSGGWSETVLYSFCSRGGCSDGSGPGFGGLIIDKVGNLYGTTAYGGAHGAGVVFRLTPKPSGPWTETVLYSFCAQKGCSDGADPAGVLMDQAGNLYGTAGQGGNTANSLCKHSNPPGCGVAFELSPNRNGGWTETVLHTFCSQNNCLDGDGAFGLIMDEAGNLYGTTVGGGNGNNICNVSSTCGLVYELTPSRSGGWSETVLYYFCSQSKCSDGANPGVGQLLIDGAGNLYGATDSGGTYQFGGVVFQLTPTRGGGWSKTVLHNFCSQPSCADGLGPQGGLIMDKAGNLYGTADGGGPADGGVVFELTGTGAQPDALSVAKSGNGSGTVTSSPAGIDCGPTCRANFNSGARVSLTASAEAGSIFAGWSGGGCGGTDTCIVTMNSSRLVAATFAVASSHTLSLGLLGVGAVVSSPSGINCPGLCSASFASGTRVTLTATPASGYRFAAWNGKTACSGTGSCTLTMNSDQSVTARFSVITYSLSASLAGSGTVTSSPAGINCPSRCSAIFDNGTQLTLTAAPASGWSFNGWGGPCAVSGGTCTLTMNSNQSVTATFSVITHSLSVATVGGGAVTSSPSGIDCPGACDATFDASTRVTLTAAPIAGWIFSGWSGACSGTGSCQLTINSDQSAAATFKVATQ